MNACASHADLLALARRIRAAVERDDTDAVHAALTRLHGALLDHVRAERDRFDGLPGSAGPVALDGQRRLLRLVTEALFGSEDRGGAGCTCLVRAAEIELALRRQARLEAALLERRGDPPGGVS